MLCLTYNVPQGSCREYLIENSVFESILDDMLNFNELYEKSCEFFICGDFNARTGERPDFVLNDNINSCLEDILPDDYVQDEYLPRCNSDKTVNENGNMLLDFCKMSGLRILNGRVG